MISFGSNIKSANDPLGKVSVRYLYDATRNPKPQILSLLSQLRVVRQLNPSLYTQLKTKLPYVVCAIFNPPARCTGNFAYTEYFIIDIDHLSSRDLGLEELRSTFKADPRVVMCFVSPGGDGLKIMMKLSERCYDAGVYKTFYKAFLMRFSVQYNLQQVVDSHTCDVARACFVSADPEVYFNPDAETIDINMYLAPDENPLDAFDVKHETDKASAEGDKLRKEEHNPEPDKDILEQIKQTLDPSLKEKLNKRPPVYVPEEINDIMADLQGYIESKGIDIVEVINIQYGKKLRCRIGVKSAEVNMFYGRRGFSVVQSPRSGTDAEANELFADVIYNFLLSNGYL